MRELLTRFKLWMIPRIAYLLITFINRTVRLKVVGENKLKNIKKDTPLLFSAWHGQTWIPIYYLRNRNYIALASYSRDGEYMTRLLQKLGWKVIRGSSSKGASRSLLKLYKELKKGASTALTPDGPTGPIYKVKPGIVYLQEKTGGVIVPLGVAIKHKKVFNSWDKYALPYPGTRVLLKVGDPVSLPVEIPVGERCLLLEKEMDQIQHEAEQELNKY